MEFETRHATSDDHAALYQIYATVMKEHVSRIWGWDEAWQTGDFDKHFLPDQITVVMVENQIVGYIHVDSRDETPHVRMMCILPEYQGKGLGSTLLRSFIQRVSAEGKNVKLGVFKINSAARRLYERLGFETCGETTTHYEMIRKTER
jgi:ribosomal protein S18 acetylase RimI-like enzyme